MGAYQYISYNSIRKENKIPARCFQSNKWGERGYKVNKKRSREKRRKRNAYTLEEIKVEQEERKMINSEEL